MPRDKSLQQCLRHYGHCHPSFHRAAMYPLRTYAVKLIVCKCTRMSISEERKTPYAHWLKITYRSPILPTNSATSTAAERDFGPFLRSALGTLYEARFCKHLGKMPANITLSLVIYSSSAALPPGVLGHIDRSARSISRTMKIKQTRTVSSSL